MSKTEEDKIIESIEIENNVIPINKITILIGPNNSGKSQFLRDIFHHMNNENYCVIIKDIKYGTPEYSIITSDLIKEEYKQNSQYWEYFGLNSKLQLANIQISKDDENNYSNNSERIIKIFNRLRLAYLDAESRLQMAKTKESSDSLKPTNLLHGWFLDKSIDIEAKSIFNKAFGIDMMLDPGTMRNLRVLVGNNLDNIPKVTREAIHITYNKNILDNQGDGFKSFVGIILTVLLFQNRIILIDEPESFLHPTQSRILGDWIQNFSQNKKNQIMIATHSSSFLAGILSALKNKQHKEMGNEYKNDSHIDIIRMNRNGIKNRFTKLSMDILENLSSSPLLSGQPIIESLFHEGVIICEADSDRIFYQTVMSRHLKNDNFVFIHAHSKETLHSIVNLLKNSSIPVLVITDFDIFNSKKTFEELIKGLTDENIAEIISITEYMEKIIIKQNIDIIKSNLRNEMDWLNKNIEEMEIEEIRNKLKNIRKRVSFWDDVKIKGLNYFEGDDYNKINSVLNKCKEFGLFIVPNGELESWLSLGIRNKGKWIVEALNTINVFYPAHLGQFLLEISNYLVSVNQIHSLKS